MQEKKHKILSPKMDTVFQNLFGEIGSEEITKGFLEAILKEKIEEIDLNKNQILRRDTIRSKLGVLDVIAQINGKENVNIEMQVVENQDERERLLYYWSRLYSRGIVIGEEYKEIPRTIAIIITDFKIKGLERLKMHSTWTIIDQETRKESLTKKLEIHIIEMPKETKKGKIIEEKNLEEEGKIKMGENKDEELEYWIEFIQNPESERVKKRMEKNKSLRLAYAKLQEISQDEEIRRLAELREKAILDEISIRKSAIREGLEEGREKGLEEGRKENLKEKKEIINKLKQRNMRIEEIAEIVNLSKDEIEEILKEDK